MYSAWAHSWLVIYICIVHDDCDDINMAKFEKKADSNMYVHGSCLNNYSILLSLQGIERTSTLGWNVVCFSETTNHVFSTNYKNFEYFGNTRFTSD